VIEAGPDPNSILQEWNPPWRVMPRAECFAIAAPVATCVNGYMKLSTHTRRLIARALEEDIGRGDVTTRAIGVAGRRGRAVLLAKSDGVLFGSQLFEEVFQELDRSCHIRWQVRDGRPYAAGTKLAHLDGDQAALLAGERTALNFLAHLSGITTLTRKFVDAVAGTRSKVLDTRKTTPGLRELEKQAVKAGGGVNHRMGLYDAVMIKNNHITACGSIEQALHRVIEAHKRTRNKLPIICETRTMNEVRKAVEYGVDWILLDHFGPERLRRVVKEVRRLERKMGCRMILESSGGVTLKNILARAQSGVDFISVGALTQSAPAVDLSLRLIS